MRTAALLLATLLATAQLAADGGAFPARRLEPAGRLDFEPIAESSGLVASRVWPGVFWTHNDSGDEARIFAVDGRGTLIAPAWDKAYGGLRLAGAVNLDWEDIAVDGDGHLLIGAFGNNGNARRDLAIYVLPEPNPRAVNAARVLKRLPFVFEDQREFPPEARNYDCEALFFARGSVHLLTKHRSDSRTVLYRLEPPPAEAALPAAAGDPWFTPFREDRMQLARRVGEADLGAQAPGEPAMVTAADLHPDGRRLALLSYRAIWLFELEPGGPGDAEGNWLAGRRSWLPIEAGQCEAIAWEGDTLVLTNEQRDLFRVGAGELRFE
jgi:hypothetical protein